MGNLTKGRGANYDDGPRARVDGFELDCCYHAFSSQLHADGFGNVEQYNAADNW